MSVYVELCAFVAGSKPHLHCVSKEVTTFKLPVTLSHLNRFLNFLYCWKRMKFATKPIRHYPAHLRHVAALPWEIKFSADIQQIWKKMQRNCILFPSNFVIHPQILILSVFNIASFPPHWLQIKFSMSLFFYLFTFAINLWHQKLVTALQCLSTINMVFSDEDKMFTKTHKYTQHTQLHV